MKEPMPSGMEEYLSTYGWHFSKKMCEWAISKMRRRAKDSAQEEPMQLLAKEDVDTIFRRYGVDPTSYTAYDAVYIYHMLMSDFYGISLVDERHLVLHVKAYLDDVDGYDEIALTRFYADCIGRGEMPPWEDCI